MGLEVAVGSGVGVGGFGEVGVGAGVDSQAERIRAMMIRAIKTGMEYCFCSRMFVLYIDRQIPMWGRPGIDLIIIVKA